MQQLLSRKKDYLNFYQKQKDEPIFLRETNDTIELASYFAELFYSLNG